jgi:hypothetical protein
VNQHLHYYQGENPSWLVIAFLAIFGKVGYQKQKLKPAGYISNYTLVIGFLKF